MRARDLGIAIGDGEPGPRNAISDVDGVLVGHSTLIEGEDVRTGVTVIVPSVIDGTACVAGSFSDVRTPRRCAMWKMLSGPTSSASRA